MNRTRRGPPFPGKPDGIARNPDESEIAIDVSKIDHQKFYDLAIRFSATIEAEHPGFGIIFSKNQSPDIRILDITAEEEDAINNHPHSVMAIRAKKRIELFEQEQYHYKTNKEAVFAKTLKLCSPQLRTVLESETGYVQVDRDKDPLALWKLIKAVVTRGPASNSDPFEDRLASIDRFRKFRQKDDESVVDFRTRFGREVEHLYDRRITVGFVSFDLLPSVDPTTPITQAVYDFLVNHSLLHDEPLIAREFVRKLDSSRFGDLQYQLSNDRAAGRDNYPTTIEAAFNLAFQYKSKKLHGGKQHGGKKQPAQEPPAVDAGGGVALTTVNGLTKEELSKQGLCFKCGKGGHLARNCTTVKKTKIVGAHIGNNVDLNQVLASDRSVSSVAFPTVGYGCVANDSSLNCRALPQSWILLDNQATVSVFSNKALLTKVRRVDEPMEVSGVGGTITTDVVGEFAPFGDVYYHPGSIGNILCFADVDDLHKVKFENGVYSVAVKGYDSPFQFKRSSKLYVMDSSSIPEKQTVVLPRQSIAFPVVTVDGNKVGFTKREIQLADEAVRLSATLGFPSTQNLIDALNQGRVRSTSVTAKDVRRAKFIYGPPVPSLMGKTKRSSPDTVNSPDVSLTPSTLADITLCADIFFVNGLAFFITISLRICLTTTKYLTDRKSTTVWQAMKATIAKYREHGFNVREVRCDGEENIGSIADELRLLGVKFNPTSKAEHEPVVERAVQTLKGTCRSLVHSLPYKLCSALLVYMVYYATSCTNMFPKRGGVSDLPPRQLLLGRSVDVSVEGKLPFGAYVHTHEDNAMTNGMEARTVGAIALGPTGNYQGGYRFLNLSTWRVINRRSWTELPMPQDIIQQMNTKATAEVRRGDTNDGTLNFTLQGVALPDEGGDNEDEGDAQEPLAYEELIGELRHADDTGADHSNPVEEELIAAPIEVPDADQREAIDQDNDGADEAHGDEDAADGDESIVHQEVDDQHVVQVSDDVEHPNAGDLIDTFMSSPVTEPSQDPVIEDTPRHGYNTRFQKRVAAGEAVALLQLSGRAAARAFGPSPLSESQGKELRQLHEKGVWHPVKYNTLTQVQKLQLMQSFCFTKQKRDGTLKSRLVSIGSKQNGPAFAGENIESSSPTVSSMAMFIVLTEIAEASRTTPVSVVTVDIEGAYLHADMPADRFLSLDRDLSKILVTMYPDVYEAYLSHNGRLCLKLDKALYGCVESAKLFYDHISTALTSIGLKINPYDICVFNGVVDNVHVTVIIHVDDLLIWSVDRRGVEYVVTQLRNIYKNLTLHEGPILDYLGIELNMSQSGTVSVSAQRMVHETLTEYKDLLTFSARTPATPNLFQVNTSSHLLDKTRAKRFHSIVAKLLYIAKHGRPDILTSVAFLTTRVVRATEEDEKKLVRVLNYLNKFPDLCMRMNGGPGALIKAFVDASYAVHVDGMSHSGVVIIVGEGGPVHVSSKKQKMVAKSSTEAELIALGDELSPVLYANHFREAQGYPPRPAILYQDNQSTIALAEKGRSTSSRTRHIAIRYFFIKDNIDRREVEVVYKPTEEMLADFFTKPLQGEQFTTLRNFIMNIEQKRAQDPHPVSLNLSTP